MTASPAADWLPFDLEVAKRELWRVRHIAYPDARCLCIKGRGTVVFDNDWLVSVTAPTLRLAPAQPAEGECFRSHPHEKMSAACERKTEQARVDHAKRVAVLANEWHPTSLLPAEGRVVELRLHKGNFVKTYGRINAGTWDIDQDSHGKHFVPFYGADSDAWEWRYPPGERAEATINAGAERGSESTRNQSADSSARENVADCPAPVPAPQRQNLAYWLALRGRAPWPEAERATLPALPITSWRIWK